MLPPTENWYRERNYRSIEVHTIVKKMFIPPLGSQSEDTKDIIRDAKSKMLIKHCSLSYRRFNGSFQGTQKQSVQSRQISRSRWASFNWQFRGVTSFLQAKFDQP
jgi:hypothetical protein